MTRLEALDRFRVALYESLRSMPAGYVGAGLDRETFATPVEELIAKVEAEINEEARRI